MNSRRQSSQPSSKKPWFKKNHSMPKNDKKAMHHIDFILVSNEQVGVSIPYNVYDSKKKQILKNNGGIWDDCNKVWVIKSEALNEVIRQFKEQYPEIDLNDIPQLTYRAITEVDSLMEIKEQKGKTVQTIKYSDNELKYNPEILLPFYMKLFPFQRESVKFGISHFGRCLLGDEMGVGKTIQALGLAYVYKSEWPLLIICPSSLKYNWQDEVLRWYKDIRQYEVQVIKKVVNSGKKDKTKIVIISYEICRRNIELFEEFRTVIVDEAHYLKTLDSKRSETLVPFLKSRKRVFLLTGTPALAKPRELFNLLSIVRPDVYYNFKEFGNRYCDPQKSPWSGSIEYNGSRHPSELYFMIKDRVMIRRLKKDVLTDLPPKMRQKITIECDNKHTKQIAAILTQTNQLLQKLSSNDEDISIGSDPQMFSTAYSLTAQAKVEGVKEYLKELIQNDVKMIIFAHHRVMMDAIDELLVKDKVVFMRIDGMTSPEQRQANVKDFQEKAHIRVALLSITAAGVGLTLTASSTVVFAEFHWTPAVMFQAEDRAHRIGQPSCVNCHYLVGQGTLDDYIYKKLEEKFNSVSLMVDGETNRIGAQELAKGEIGNVSKAAQMIKKLEQSQKKEKDMHRLSNYFKSMAASSQISDISSSDKNRQITKQQVEDVDSETDSEEERKDLEILFQKQERRSQEFQKKRIPQEEPEERQG